MTTDSIIRIYNTLTREIEDFVPLSDKRVTLYACGPTVYDYTHIGHIRAYLTTDILVRLLRYLNFNVIFVMNITDVGHLVSDADSGEDKMEKGAHREGKTAWEIAKFFETDVFSNMEKMNIIKPDIICRATEHISDQINLIKILEQKGYTYKIADGVYFDSTKFANYGKLAGLNLEGQKMGARVEEVQGKKHATDFALWKFTPHGVKRDMEWESPWGKGFPGWHIECSAMSMKYLGETIDIHRGGFEHIPIHHTNEIAQSEAATGKQFVKYWVHNNFLQINGQKMSKSADNFIRLDTIINKGFSPMALRYLLLQTHYRQEANFTWEALTAAQNAHNQLVNTIKILKSQYSHTERAKLSEEKLNTVNTLRKKFKDIMRLDLNTPQALAVVWEIVKSNVPSQDKYDLLMITDEILGLGFKDITQSAHDEIPEEIYELVRKREDYRHQNLWTEADEVRKLISTKGYLVEDSSSGPKVKKIS